MCDMTYRCRDTSSPIPHRRSLLLTWRISMRDLTYFYAWHGLLRYRDSSPIPYRKSLLLTRRISMCNTTCFYAWHDLLRCWDQSSPIPHRRSFLLTWHILCVTWHIALSGLLSYVGDLPSLYLQEMSHVAHKNEISFACETRLLRYGRFNVENLLYIYTHHRCHT